MLNYTTVQGRMTRTPELRVTNNGKSVASFTIAWSEKFGDTERKLFLPCVIWGKSAEFVSKFFVKGQEAVVEGKLTARKWQDKEGNNRETTELIANSVHFCGSKQSHDPIDANDFADLPEDDGDLPF